MAHNNSDNNKKEKEVKRSLSLDALRSLDTATLQAILRQLSEREDPEYEELTAILEILEERMDDRAKAEADAALREFCVAQSLTVGEDGKILSVSPKKAPKRRFITVGRVAMLAVCVSVFSLVLAAAQADHDIMRGFSIIGTRIVSVFSSGKIDTPFSMTDAPPPAEQVVTSTGQEKEYASLGEALGEQSLSPQLPRWLDGEAEPVSVTVQPGRSLTVISARYTFEGGEIWLTIRTGAMAASFELREGEQVGYIYAGGEPERPVEHTIVQNDQQLGAYWKDGGILLHIRGDFDHETLEEIIHSIYEQNTKEVVQ